MCEKGNDGRWREVGWSLNGEDLQGCGNGSYGKSDILEQKWGWGQQYDQSNQIVGLFSIPTILPDYTLITSVITVNFQTSNLKPCHD